MWVTNLLFMLVLGCFYRAFPCDCVMIFQIVIAFLGIRKETFSTLLYPRQASTYLMEELFLCPAAFQSITSKHFNYKRSIQTMKYYTFTHSLPHIVGIFLFCEGVHRNVRNNRSHGSYEDRFGRHNRYRR